MLKPVTNKYLTVSFVEKEGTIVLNIMLKPVNKTFWDFFIHIFDRDQTRQGWS